MRINLADGRTISYDLEEDHEAWNAIERSRAGQCDIRGLVLDERFGSVAVPRPSRFRDVAYAAATHCVEGRRLAERVTVQADDVRLTVISYQSGAVRVELTRTGRPRFLAQFKGEHEDAGSEHLLRQDAARAGRERRR